VTEVRVTQAARDAQHSPWPAWVPVEARCTWGHEPWSHQVAAAESAHAGHPTVIATGTASGKTLAYAMPVAAALADGATALYLSPTKALAADQLAAWEEWSLVNVRAATVDGDTPREHRAWARAHATLILTNPDMLHYALLPDHARWSRFWRRLAYVVVDEAHAYRGVFGAHVSQVLRRVRRVAAHHRGTPTFILASATMGDPRPFAERLTGLPAAVFDEDSSPAPERTIVLRTPPEGPDGEEESAVAYAADLLAHQVDAGISTVAFVRSRRGVEYAAMRARQRAGDPRIAAYRGGYLPEERRELERQLRSGAIVGMAATSALELGIDITGLDSVITAGWPGTRASVWQQFGRAGRASAPALVHFIARDDPLDRYVVHHPETLLDSPMESSVFDPANPVVLAPHLCCAAAELPLTIADLSDVFPSASSVVVEELVGQGLLRRRPSGWFWTHRDAPHRDTSLRGSGAPEVRVVEVGTGRLLGTVDSGASHGTVHAGAVYVHQGVTHVITNLDLLKSVAFARVEEVDYTTIARDISDIRIVDVEREDSVSLGVTMFLGRVDVTNRVVSFQRRRISGENLGEEPLDLPERILRTQAVWWTLPKEWITDPATPGSVHGAEHAAIGMLPLFATCDRWDIGGVSTAAHPDTGTATIFIYDGHPGGAGFAAHGFDVASDWLAATRQAIIECACDDGCPGCIQSPKCGNGNDPLEKQGTVRVLTELLTQRPVRHVM
jgi:DEAD/DEAH box helicase domain-containing protein